MSANNEIGTPPGWIAGKISDFVYPRGEKALPSSLPDAIFLGMDHVEAHTTRIIGGVPASEMKSAGAKFYRGDVLYGRLRPYLNKVATPGFDGLASAEFIVFPDSQLLHSQLLKHRLNASDFVSFASHLNEGDRPRVDFDQIGAFPILLPPAAEQRRIVAKIEELFSELDKGIESLTTARAQLNAYRQSVLKVAFEGKLTESWRAENADKLEAPESLLARIIGEREARYKKALDEWREAIAKWRVGKEKPAKPKPPRQLSKLAEARTSNGVWPILELGDLLSVSSGMGLTSQQMRDGPYAVYGGNGINGSHDQYFIEEPELIIGRVGAKCGVTHITQPQSWVTDNALIVTPLIRSFDKRFFKWLLEIKNLNILGSSTGQPVISGSKIYPVEVCLPSYAEQVEITRILEGKLEGADVMAAEIEAGFARADALRQSILKRAFSGQLVAQDPSDEPASFLLERIRAEREADTITKRRRSKTGNEEAA